MTNYRKDDVDLFVQEKNVAIYVLFHSGGDFHPGDRVLITGKTKASFRPIVVADHVKVLRHGSLPSPLPVGFKELMSAQYDCLRVKLRAVVHSADMGGKDLPPEIDLRALMDGGYIDVALNSSDQTASQRLLDADVEIVGVVTSKYNLNMQLTGVLIIAQSLSDVKILKPALQSRDSIPFTPITDVLSTYNIRDFTSKVRVRGTLTYYQEGTTAVLQNGSKCLWIVTRTNEPLRVGDVVEATGFPSVRNNHPVLLDAEIRDTHQWAPITPQNAERRVLEYGGRAFDLVTTSGRVVRQVREAAVDEYILETNGHIFSAIYRHPPRFDWASAPPMKMIPLGSEVQVTGIGMFYTSDPFNGPIASDILLRSSDDVQVIGRPPLLNTRNLIRLAVVLLAALVMAGLWSWWLGRKVLRQTAAMSAQNAAAAKLESHRSHILEEINNFHPLTGILTEITAMVSLQLQGAPCWCEIDGGVVVGQRPAETDTLRIVQREIPARSGHALGLLSAALDSQDLAHDDEVKALSAGIHLATLAIESQRLNVDLHRRLEFDMLTDIHNRFSFDGYCDACVAEADRNASIFGLVYVDLDDFKQVNDRYGHHIGDFYLQEVARRMKGQLRDKDMVARMGGDEFSLLLPAVRSQEEVFEIAQRIERCFDQPLSIEGLSLQASISTGIALYPANGRNKEELLRAADEAMYAVKHPKQMKREQELRMRQKDA